MPYVDKQRAIHRAREYYHTFKDRILEERTRRQIMSAVAKRPCEKSCLELLQNAKSVNNAEYSEGQKVDGGIHRAEENDTLRVCGHGRLHQDEGQGAEKAISGETSCEGKLE